MSRSEFKEGWESFKRFAKLFNEAYNEYLRLNQNPTKMDFEDFWQLLLSLGLNRLHQMNVQQVLKVMEEGKNE